ncbi:hypothetical protein SESBI_49650 [Sesbania bispinosa]|nr:hypothetical protein SESBI_49650 [Sesbania bispinosa]
MRTFSKNKFLLCFRPVVDIDTMLDSKALANHSASCRFPCKPVSEKHEMMKSSENKHVFFSQGSAKFSESWIMQHPPKRTICKVIKAVVFETILNRRTRHKNRYNNNDSFGSKHNYSTTYKEIKSPQSPLSTSSSSNPKVLSQSKNLSKYNSTKERSHGGLLEKQKKSEWYGIWLVLLSLALTVLCGKLFGIILTSIWLCFLPVWDSSYHCQKRLPSGPRERQSLQSKYRGHYGSSALRELHYHNGH